ncbi:efflux RND transporter permease subunit [Aestuariibius sp. 2305UL40-4]|uniref:efflux RND transporter permease subunit n=1 Tax=Aestuariibius violaceus TaxID=3234132 RepID=UPI00345E4645
MNGAIKWMAEHPVAAMLTMVLVVALGALSIMAIPQKTFPEITLDSISISVNYTGAAPEEIEDSIVRPIEDALSGVDGIDEITASISEGRGSVTVTFLLGEEVQEKLNEIQTEVDGIDVFPEDADDPVIVEGSSNTRVLEIAIHGAASERVLTEEAERLRDELILLPSISFVEVSNRRAYEVTVEVDRDTLRAYDMTIGEIAQAIRQNSLELPGGAIDTETVSIPIRTTGRNYTQSDFENIIVRTGADGGRVYLRDIATVIDGFEDTDLSATFNGERSVAVNVFRVGDEQVLGIVDEAQAYLTDTFRPSLQEGISATVWQNDARELQSRLDLLTSNAIIGLTLVVICLALFLDFRLAAWSAIGIGVSFAAALAVMSFVGMSINMISLFGFILAIGIIVDNAIVVSENIYTNGERGLTPIEAAVKGTQRIAVPVVFSTITTLVAFWPLLQLPGTLGKFLSDIPLVVMIVLSLSLLQALFILPRNLSRLDVSENYRPNIVLRALRAVRGAINSGLQWFIAGPLDATLRFTTRRVLIPIGGMIGLMIVTIGLLAHGYVKFNFFPSIDGTFVTANIEMSDGTTFTMTERVAEDVRFAAIEAAEGIQDRLPNSAPPVLAGMNVVVGQGAAEGGPGGGSAASGATVANVIAEITDPELRDWPTREFEAAWIEAIGDIPGVNSLTVSAQLVGAGDPIAVELSLPDGQDITPVVDELREGLRGIPGVFSIRDDNSAGRAEYRLALRDEARVYGVTLEDLATQTRSGFFGLEATTVQRGADNIAVMVRFPAEERDSLSDLLDTWIATPAGETIPLSTVARIEEGLAPTEIQRRNGRTITTVTADVDSTVITSQEANTIIEDVLLPPLRAQYDGLIVDFGGEQRTQGDAAAALGQAVGIALFAIFALLALVFRSYVQPIVVMLAIPLGLIGAVAGHLIMGLPLTLLSIFGIIGLAGVVINNSLVMVDLYNEYLGEGMELREAVIRGTKERFRPILLTSLTTFLGVYPLILETSLQAQFLIPLAVSIGYGVLFGTVIVILCVPAIFVLQARVTTLVTRILSLGSDAESAKPDLRTVAEVPQSDTPARPLAAE